jgi:hypothetical protein
MFAASTQSRLFLGAWAEACNRMRGFPPVPGDSAHGAPEPLVVAWMMDIELCELTGEPWPSEPTPWEEFPPPNAMATRMAADYRSRYDCAMMARRGQAGSSDGTPGRDDGRAPGGSDAAGFADDGAAEGG